MVEEELRLKVENGALIYDSSRMWVLNPYAIAEIQRAMRQIIGPAYRTILFRGAREGARKFVEDTLSRSTLAEMIRRFGWGRRKIIEELCRIATRLGFGRMELVAYDEKNDRLTLRVFNSPIPSVLESDIPVCDLTRGVIAGALEALTRKPYTVEETKCSVLGDEYCQFEVKRKE